MISEIPVAKLCVPVVVVSVGGVDSKIVVIEDSGMGEQEVERRGHLPNLRVCLPSLESRVHTLMAKSCSLGSGERRERLSRS